MSGGAGGGGGERAPSAGPHAGAPDANGKPQPLEEAQVADAPAKRRWVATARRWAVDVAIVVAVIVAISAWKTRGLLPEAEEPAPAFTLRDLAGGEVSLSDFEGEAVLLHFWATWCGVCRKQHGELGAVSRWAGPGRRVVAIAVDSGEAEAVRAYAESKGLEYTILLDDGTVAERYRVGAFPTNYTLDRAHRVVHRQVGWSTRWGMRFRLARAARG